MMVSLYAIKHNWLLFHIYAPTFKHTITAYLLGRLEALR